MKTLRMAIACVCCTRTEGGAALEEREVPGALLHADEALHLLHDLRAGVA